MMLRFGARVACSAALSVFGTACGSSVVVVVEDDEPIGEEVVEPGEVEAPGAAPEKLDPAVNCDEMGEGAAFSVSTFEATYYWEDDGEQYFGNDGTDPDIVPEYHGSEVVALPSINYVSDDYLGIDSYGFYGTWDGSLEVHAPNASLDANFDMSWASATFFVDGELVDRWNDDSKSMGLQLSQGAHTIRVEYHNHWHTTGFSASFTDYPVVPLSQSVSATDPFVDADTKVAFVGAYESGALHNEVTVEVEASASPVLLVLHSFRAIHWQIVATSCIAGVVIHAAWPGSTVTGIGTRPILAVDGWYQDEDGTVTSELVDREADHASYAYTITHVVVPKLD